MPTVENPSLMQTPDDFLAIIRRQQLGKLKIYLGPCPGVGKTFQMLIEGNRLRKQGVDVVIGYVEPHDRPETTAQIGELEIVPPLVAKYHGITLKEMDVDAVLARKPTIALVDELAHTNAPQSRNRKRRPGREHRRQTCPILTASAGALPQSPVSESPNRPPTLAIRPLRTHRCHSGRSLFAAGVYTLPALAGSRHSMAFIRPPTCDTQRPVSRCPWHSMTIASSVRIYRIS